MNYSQSNNYIKQLVLLIDMDSVIKRRLWELHDILANISHNISYSSDNHLPIILKNYKLTVMILSKAWNLKAVHLSNWILIHTSVNNNEK